MLIGIPLLFICGDVHIKSTSSILKLLSPLTF
jgi:hypothetical protein